MPESEAQSLSLPPDLPKRPSPADGYVNIVYKMLRDGHADNASHHDVMRQGYGGNGPSLVGLIHNISRNNFPGRKTAHPESCARWDYPAGITVIKRSSLLRHILTVNPKKKKDGTVSLYYDRIKEKFPVVETVEKMFLEFHAAIMGKDPDAIDGFCEKYGDTEISSLCDSIARDIASVRNAVSMEESSGFVEGCNNKFKLVKRTLYGRAGLPNLGKKCKLAFAAKAPGFSLADLL
jgi:hypothetical protein